jgi:cytochrome c-type biogenesis protein CcmE
MRLIGVTAVILVAIVAAVVLIGFRQGAQQVTVASVTKDSSLVGKRVKVGGAVVAGSWNKQASPMKFTIRDETDKSGTGPSLKIVYSGNVPSAFGDGVTAIVTGTLEQGGVIDATEMITKCPSKYESAVGATPVQDLMGKGASMAGKPVRTVGFVKPGSISTAASGDRFIVAEKPDGTGLTVGVVYTAVLPDGMKDGSKVVLGGELDQSGKFIATSVALEQSQK